MTKTLPGTEGHLIAQTVRDYFEGWFDADVDRGADRTLNIEVEDTSDGTASVTVRSAVYHEHLHLVPTRDGWKIANALWRYS